MRPASAAMMTGILPTPGGRSRRNRWPYQMVIGDVSNRLKLNTCCVRCRQRSVVTRRHRLKTVSTIVSQRAPLDARHARAQTVTDEVAEHGRRILVGLVLDFPAHAPERKSEREENVGQREVGVAVVLPEIVAARIEPI